MRARLERSGTTPEAERIAVGLNANDTVFISRHPIDAEWNPRHADRNDRIITKIRTDDIAVIERCVNRFASLALALRARHRAIEGREDHEQVPAWSLVAHPLVRALLRNAGIEPDALTRYRRMSGGFATNDLGMECGDGPEQRIVRIGGTKHSLRINRIGISGGVLRMDARSNAEEMAIQSDAAGQTVTLPHTTLPDTLIAAAAGRPFDEVLEHDLMRGSGAVVTSALNMKDGTLAIRTKRALEPLAHPPEGMDAWWLDEIAKGR